MTTTTDAAMALLAEIETLSSLVRATSELGSSIPTHDERVRDLIRLVDLAGVVVERVRRAAATARSSEAETPLKVSNQASNF